MGIWLFPMFGIKQLRHWTGVPAFFHPSSPEFAKALHGKPAMKSIGIAVSPHFFFFLPFWWTRKFTLSKSKLVNWSKNKLYIHFHTMLKLTTIMFWPYQTFYKFKNCTQFWFELMNLQKQLLQLRETWSSIPFLLAHSSTSATAWRKLHQGRTLALGIINKNPPNGWCTRPQHHVDFDYQTFGIPSASFSPPFGMRYWPSLAKCCLEVLSQRSWTLSEVSKTRWSLKIWIALFAQIHIFTSLGTVRNPCVLCSQNRCLLAQKDFTPHEEIQQSVVEILQQNCQAKQAICLDLNSKRHSWFTTNN